MTTAPGSAAATHPTYHATGQGAVDSWGANALVPTIIEHAIETSDPIAAVTKLLSFEGRVPPKVGASALPLRERVAWAVASHGRPQTQRVGNAHGSMTAYALPDGRLRLGEPVPTRRGALLPSDRRPWLPVGSDGRAIGAIELDREQWTEWMVRDAATVHIETSDRECLNDWLGRLTDERVEQLCRELNVILQHAAPIVWFFGSERISNFTDENIAGKALLPHAPRNVFDLASLEDVHGSTVEVQYALLAASVLMSAGGAHRLEERNWSQVYPSDVRAHLEAARAVYRRLEGSSHQPSVGPGETAATYEGLVALAERALVERERVSLRRQRYRSISAVVLHKAERFAPPEAASRARKAFREALAAGTRDLEGPMFEAHQEIDDYIRAVAESAVAPADFASAYEEAIAATVVAVQRATSSDIAMSRGLRYPNNVERLVQQQRWDALSQREQTDYYCCALPSPDVLLGAQRRHLPEMLWAMAARMQYNTWHFVGGNLPATGVNAGRDRFIPPRFPDVSAWSDQHHSGHVSTGVRFAVRAPAPIALAERVLWGAYDVRLMRMERVPYTHAEMMIAMAGAHHAARLADAARRAASRNGLSVEIETFRRDWYVRGAFADFISSTRV